MDTGDEVTVTEDLPGTNAGGYDTELTCDNGVVPDAGTFTVTAALADTTVTCTFTNTRQSATVVLQKHWNNGATGDQAVLSLAGGTPDPATATSTVTDATGPTFTDEDNQAAAGVDTGDEVTVTEDLPGTNAGGYDTELTCDNGVVPDAGTFTVTAALADTTVTCTFTNTRQSATVVLQKHWNNGATGDQAVLSLAGGTPDPATATSTVTDATGPTFTDEDNQAAAGVDTGDEVTVTEDLPGTNAGGYDTELTCDNGVVPDAGTFTVTAALADTTVTCTFTNTRQSATVVLQKHWNNGATGDQAVLSLAGGTPDPATATSTVTDATGPTFTDEDNQAAAGVDTGDEVTVTEDLPGTNAGGYDTELTCDNGVVPDAGTFTVTAALADTTVTCTFTNTRQSATVVLQKHWNNGATGDQAVLSLAGGTPDPATATSTVTDATGPTFTDEDNQAAAGVDTGDEVTVTEDLPGTNAGGYDTELTCDNGVVPDAGTFTVTAALADTTVTCTFTNTRQSATVVLQKHWNNGATGDQAVLSLAGGTPDPATATSTVTDATGPTFTDEDNQAAAGVDTGDEVTVTEDLPGTNAGGYDTELTCDNGVVPDAGTFTVTAALADTTVTCTFTNTRQSATVVLQKHWNNGATGDQAVLSLAGGTPDPATATSTVTDATGPTFTDEDNQAAAGVDTGDEVTVTEDLPGTNAGGYDTELTCDNGVVPDAGTFTVTAALADTTVTCTFTNTRQSATVVLQKHWNNGATGDQAVLSLAGGTPDPATATSTVTDATGPTFTDEDNQAAAGVDTGDEVTVTEDLPGTNAGGYDTELTCDNGVVPDAGTFTVTAALADTTVTCTFTNTRQSATVVLQKHWNNGATGDQAVLSLAGGTPDPATATSTVTDATGPTFTDEDNQAAAGVDTGDEVTVTEDLPGTNAGGYDTELTCDNGVVPDAGTFTVTAALADTTVTCTFTNTRQSATVVLQKHWNNGATGDQAVLSLAGGTPDPATATSTVTDATGPTFTDEDNQAAAGVDTGDEVTVTEDLPGTNAGGYDTELTCDNGVVPDAGTFTVTAALADTTVTCTFTNTRQSATVVLQKHWNNGATGDQAVLSLAGGTPDPATATSTVTDATGPTFTDEDNQAAAGVDTGDEVTVTEDLPGTNAGGYDTELTCDNGVVPDAGTFTVTAALADTTVTCTFTNTRQSATVVLQKHWNNGATGDQAVLSLAGGTPDPATATSTVTDATGPTFTDEDNQAAAGVDTGDEVTVTEDLPGTNAGGYDTELTCDNGVVPDAGTFTVTAALADTTVTCTFTNTRQRGSSTPPSVAPGQPGSPGSPGTPGSSGTPGSPGTPGGAGVPTAVDAGLPGAEAAERQQAMLVGLMLLVSGAALLAGVAIGGRHRRTRWH